MRFGVDVPRPGIRRWQRRRAARARVVRRLTVCGESRAFVDVELEARSTAVGASGLETTAAGGVGRGETGSRGMVRRGLPAVPARRCADYLPLPSGLKALDRADVGRVPSERRAAAGLPRCDTVTLVGRWQRPDRRQGAVPAGRVARELRHDNEIIGTLNPLSRHCDGFVEKRVADVTAAEAGNGDHHILRSSNRPGTTATSCKPYMAKRSRSASRGALLAVQLWTADRARQLLAHAAD